MRSEIIRPYLERLIGEWLEEPVSRPDEQGRYHVRVNTSGFVVEIVDFEPTLVRMWSPAVMGIDKSIDLLDTLNGLNANGLGLRAFHTDDKVVLATELVAETLDARELHFACHLLAGAAERRGPPAPPARPAPPSPRANPGSGWLEFPPPASAACGGAARRGRKTSPDSLQ